MMGNPALLARGATSYRHNMLSPRNPTVATDDARLLREGIGVFIGTIGKYLEK